MEAQRRREYWTQIPNHVGGVKGLKLLESWGISFWPNGQDLDYEGWQRVHLPTGWSLSVEGYWIFLLDDKNQIRGKIVDAFKRVERSGSIAEAFKKAVVKAGGLEVKKKPKVPSGPRLELRTCIVLRHSFCLGPKGPYSFWAENAHGKTLYAIRDVYISDDEAEQKLPALEGDVLKWLKENYPRWNNPYYYWNRFV